jgi:hypothetical protein
MDIEVSTGRGGQWAGLGRYWPKTTNLVNPRVEKTRPYRTGFGPRVRRVPGQSVGLLQVGHVQAQLFFYYIFLVFLFIGWCK